MVRSTDVMAAVIILTLMAGMALATSTSTTTRSPYIPLTNPSVYFYDGPGGSVHNLNVSGRSILWEIHNHGNVQDHSAGPTLFIGSLLIFNGTHYARYDWACQGGPCEHAPGPARYFVFAGYSTRPDVNWSRDDTGNGPYRPLGLSGGGYGGWVEVPLRYDWVPGHLYAVLLQEVDGTFLGPTKLNAPATDPLSYCADYSCSPLFNPPTATRTTSTEKSTKEHESP